MQPDWSLVGEWLLVGSIIVIAIECVLAVAWSMRLARHGQALQARLVQEQGRIQSDVERLRLALAETVVLWQPYGRLLRWLRHPLTIALLQSFARRRAAPR